MDLGLSKLSDDQAISLLQQVLSELATRDPIVRQLTQQQIVSESEKLDIAKAALSKALAAAKQEYIATLERDVDADVRAAVKEGTIRLPINAETEEIVKAHRASLKRLWVESNAPRLIKNDFEFHVADGSVQLKRGGQAMTIRHALSDREWSILAGAISQCWSAAADKVGF